MEDFASALSVQLRHEIATRYFGFRKEIEEQNARYNLDLENCIPQHLLKTQQRLNLLHQLLVKPIFYDHLCSILALPQDLCHSFDPGNTEQTKEFPDSPRGTGLTKRGRYRDLCLQHTALLLDCLTSYFLFQEELREEHKRICNRIDEFERQNDISLILSFLRGLDGHNPEEIMPAPSTSSADHSLTLTEQMRLPKPIFPSNLPAIAHPPVLRDIKATLIPIFNNAHRQNSKYIHQRFPC